MWNPEDQKSPIRGFWESAHLKAKEAELRGVRAIRRFPQSVFVVNRSQTADGIRRRAGDTSLH